MIKNLVIMLVLLLIIALASPSSFAYRQSNHAIKKEAGSSLTAGQTGGESDDDEGGESSNRMGLSESDKRFVITAARSVAAETEMARLAISKSANEDVQKLARRLIDNHSRTMGELEKLVSDKGIARISLAIDSQSARADKTALQARGSALKASSAKNKTIERLSRQTGAKFDVEYLRQVKKNLEKIIEMFRRTAILGHDVDLTLWAGKKMALLGDHIQMSGSVLEKIKRSN